MTDPDLKLQVAAAQRGDRAAAVAIIERLYARVYAFLRRLSANDADAADLTQQTFGRVWTALPTFAGKSSVASWIHSIAYHVYVDWRRGSRRTEPRSEPWWAALPSSEPPPDEQAARADLANRLYATVDKLETDLRDTIHLHYYQGLTLDETASALSVATSTVKYRLRSALDELQKQMANRAPLTAGATARIL
jgi:RNA polymerase sigma-70 factor (ECF subfamily)